MSRLQIYAVIALAGLSACRSSQHSQMTGDRQLQIQFQELKADDNQIRTIQVRIFPDRTALAGLSKEGREKLWYQMDSCFYLEKGAGKIYPSSVTPVANGLNASFEYLVSFEGTVQAKGDARLIYQDRYLNHKRYELYKHL